MRIMAEEARVLTYPEESNGLHAINHQKEVIKFTLQYVTNKTT